MRKGVQKVKKLASLVSKKDGKASGSGLRRPASPPRPEVQPRQRGRRPVSPRAAPLRRPRSRRLATHPPEEQQVEEEHPREEEVHSRQEEEVPEDLMHPVFFVRPTMCYRQEVDSRQWDPPEEGEEFVDPDEELRKILPGSRPVYCRGISSLPDLDDWLNTAGKIVLIATGERTFEYKDDVKPPRVYSSILGCLVRKHFPGFIPVSKILGSQCVAWTWKHYMYAKDPEGEFDNAQQRVLDDFWKYFAPDPEHRLLCYSVANAVATKQVRDMHYEGRVWCVRNWYAEMRKIRITKKKARQITMEPWQYLQVPPQYVGLANKEVFESMVRYWTSKEFKKKHDNGVKRKAEMGHRGCHRQGSLSLAGHIQKERRETKVEPSFFTVWKRTRTLDEPDPDRKGSMWVSDGSELRHTEYCKKLGEMHGTDVDPLGVPFDPEVAVLAGQGKRNGRLWIGDGCIHPATIPSIRQLRRGRDELRSSNRDPSHAFECSYAKNPGMSFILGHLHFITSFPL
ncbi:uncharacterized protein LOC124655813 [Lolium rigidum]|uniref:uncharacterized protein LOC124655813 n=1 Tax=Lolium rigidum TaxID=89674 RepID=UPI001F5E07C3|nr:uncharacterized protein LOC124655813 [Lolium rigidum]